jgi:membrane protein DedA with SNARE-associated domain
MVSYFSALKDLASTHPHYAYVAVFLLALSEAIPAVGTVVPGSTLVLGISALATSGDADPWVLLLAATTGAIAGDGFSFWLGRHYRGRILNAWPLSRYPQLIAQSEALIAQYGAASVVLARFAAVVRAFVPLIAGILRMSPRQFYAANILSAVIWASVHVFPGVLLAVGLQLIGASAEQRTILIIAGLIIAILVIFVMHLWFRAE